MGRVFKTKWFAKTAKKAKIGDDELCEAISELKEGKGVDLGGGVFKKRLDRNERRAIVLAKAGTRWIYAYLFAKKDRDNIDTNELEAFKKLAKVFADMSDEEIEKAKSKKELVEICNDEEV